VLRSPGNLSVPAGRMKLQRAVPAASSAA
jgi:hypothetical protein